jgi:hypothetical protein
MLRKTAVVFGLLLILLGACSEEDNPYWFEDASRSAGTARPETLRILASRDTTVEWEVGTGSSPYLMVGRYGGVEAVAYLKYTSLPDSSTGITGGTLDFWVVEGWGEPVHLELYQVSPGQSWDEDEIRWDERPAVEPVALDRSAERLNWVAGDTIPHIQVLRVPPEVLKSWVEDPSSNAGLMLTVPEGEEGMLRILSADAELDTGNVRIVNPPLTITYEEATPSTHGPSQDAFVEHRLDGTRAWGEDPTWIGVGGGRPRRTLIGFDLTGLVEELRRPPTFSVAQARLVLTILPDPPDSLPYADSLRVMLFPIGEFPGGDTWAEGEAVGDSLPLVTEFFRVVDVLREDGTVEIDLTPLVRDWLTGARVNEGVALLTTEERTSLLGVGFPSRLSEDGPTLRIVRTFPPPSRLGREPEGASSPGTDSDETGGSGP